jgi:ribonuclease HI
MAEKQKFYVIWKGRRTGIFSSWKEAASQVNGFTGARYKAFSSRQAAEQALREKYEAYVGKPVSSGEWLFTPNPPVTNSIVVDAACSGNPGLLEYRGIDLQSGKEVFRKGPYKNGTNNVGEFLAIVQALALLEEEKDKNHHPLSRQRKQANGSGIPSLVYSDSEIAIGWVKKKKCKTRLVADKTNVHLFELIRCAEDWLTIHKTTTPVGKWDTRAWGEIPADFDRK